MISCLNRKNASKAMFDYLGDMITLFKCLSTNVDAKEKEFHQIERDLRDQISNVGVFNCKTFYLFYLSRNFIQITLSYKNTNKRHQMTAQNMTRLQT